MVFSWKCLTGIVAIFDVLICIFYLFMWFAIVLFVYGLKFLFNLLGIHIPTSKWLAVLTFLFFALLLGVAVLLLLSTFTKRVENNPKQCFTWVAAWVVVNGIWFFYTIYVSVFESEKKGYGITILVIKAAFLGGVIMYGLELRDKLKQVQAQPPPVEEGNEAGNPNEPANPEGPVPKHKQGEVDLEKN